MKMLDFNDILPLEGINTIIVSGPQRSGTTICAEMIARDLGWDVVREEEFSVDNMVQFRNIAQRKNVVIQAPGVFVYLDQVDRPDVLFVIMKRNIEDIIASQERIDWNAKGDELRKLLEKGINAKEPAVGKYEYLPILRKKLTNVFIMAYDNLRYHEMWVDKEHRKHFKPRQTKL